MWTNIDTELYETYPPEGVDVLVSDGENFDIAWYIMSGEYKWLKTHIFDDDCYDFTSFIPTKWRPIPNIFNETV